ncbi:MAG: AraC family transcriptional regulator [Clostridia bacterium]|nr:AraC family transcriptional regulator [Clostridia bacterium]
MILPILLNKTKLLPVYVVGSGGDNNQLYRERPYGFSNYQILYCTGGNGVYKTENKEYKISRGDAFFFRPDIPHVYYPIGDNWQVRWIVFTGRAVEDILLYLGFGNSEVFHIPELKEFDIQVSSLSDMFQCDDPNKEIKTSMLMYKILIKISEYKYAIAKTGGLSMKERYKKLVPVIEMLKERYTEDISLADMAEVIGVTTNHLCRLFQQVYSTTPLKYLTHLRLNMAKQLLSSSNNMKIRDIAEKSGFKDPSYFCLVFKKSEGITPEDYRKINTF